MTHYQHKKGNRIIKNAYLFAIRDIMTRNATARFVWVDEGFSSVEDMLHFTSQGHKCILLGVGCPDLTAGTLPLTVYTEFEGKMDYVDVTLNISEIHIKSLGKIACEVYDALWKPEQDDDWDIYADQLIAKFLDTYM